MSHTPAKRFFVTSGKGISELSTLNAFDAALVSAGIGQCNLVPVTSIIPIGAVHVREARILPGTVTFVVLAHTEGCADETLSAAVAWGMTSAGYGMVFEVAGRADRAEVERQARDGLNGMARPRRVSLKDIEVRAESLVVERGFGSVVAALVLLQRGNR